MLPNGESNDRRKPKACARTGSGVGKQANLRHTAAFLFSRPLPLEEFERVLHRASRPATRL